jgi:hypothetical protein
MQAGEAAEVLLASPGDQPQPNGWANLRPVISRAITIATVLATLSACADPSASLDRKMSEIRREQCDPLPIQPQRAACIQQFNDIEDETLRQLDEARRRQAIQGTVDQVRVINQTGRQW